MEAGKLITILLLNFALVVSCSDEPTSEPPSNLDGPISKPVSGYGADGPHEVAKIVYENPAFSQLDPEIFYPKDIAEPRPTIFFAHGYGGNQSAYYQGTLEFIAKKGYVAVFVPYPTLGVTIDDRYDILWAGFKEAVAKYPALIDTTKIGFMGHSFGAGAIIGLGYKGFVEEGWGENGRFLFPLAQWYSYQLTDEQLENFPDNTKLIEQVYADDDVNDHRMAIDIFNHINIPDTEKDYIMMETDEIDGYTYIADHRVPTSVEGSRPFDAYDYYGIYRLLDALMDYSFNNNPTAKNVALGNGSPEQITMPAFKGETLTPLISTDEPTPVNAQDFYTNPCNGIQNPRSSACE